jgi:hypothetical protein
MDGNFKVEYSTGEIYEGIVLNERRSGYGKYFDAIHKTRYFGEWSNNLKHGIGMT